MSFSFFALSFSAFSHPSPTILLSSSYVTVGFATIAHFCLPKLFLVSLILSILCFSSTYFSLNDCYHFGSNFFVSTCFSPTTMNEAVDLLVCNLVGCLRFD